MAFVRRFQKDPFGWLILLMGPIICDQKICGDGSLFLKAGGRVGLITTMQITFYEVGDFPVYRNGWTEKAAFVDQPLENFDCDVGVAGKMTEAWPILVWILLAFGSGSAGISFQKFSGGILAYLATSGLGIVQLRHGEQLGYTV